MKENDELKKNELALLKMKNINEIELNDIQSNEKSKLQTFVDSIEGCDGELTYVDRDNWIMTFA